MKLSFLGIRGYGIMPKMFSWEDLLSEVSRRVPPQQFKVWFEQLRFGAKTDRSLTIEAPSVFIRDWVNDHFREDIASVLRESFGLTLDLVIETASADRPVLAQTGEIDSSAMDSAAMLALPKPTKRPTPTLSKEQPSLFDFTAAAPSEGQAPDSSQDPTPETLTPLSVRDLAAPIVKTLGQPLNPKHSFDTFVVGASNQFAHAAARAVAEMPATQYNPLFIYSDAGLGKTHLLHAIGNYMVRNNPKAKICYISAEKFTNDLIDSIQHGKMSAFRSRYRDTYDILLMDDIQFIANKDRTQEEFFHTFNALHSSRRQIVVTSDKSPRDIPGLEDRIRTRFEWGLIADIQPPEIETRIAILRAKAEMDDIFLPHDVALFLASNIKSNIRELEGSLIRLGAQASLSGSEISLDLAKQLFSSIIKEPSSSVTPDSILDAVSRHFGIKIADLKSTERSRKFALPRQISMFLMRKYSAGKSFSEIGQILGGKDHSTVHHGVKLIAKLIERDSDVRRDVEEIQNVL